MVRFVLGDHNPQPLESHRWDGGDIGANVVEFVGGGSLDKYGGSRWYDVFVCVAFIND